jgi:hypothetical protein
LVLPVDELTGFLYILGHPWRAAAEHSNLAHLSGDCQEKERPGILGCSLPKKSRFSGLARMTRVLSWTLRRRLELWEDI